MGTVSPLNISTKWRNNTIFSMLTPGNSVLLYGIDVQAKQKLSTQIINNNLLSTLHKYNCLIFPLNTRLSIDRPPQHRFRVSFSGFHVYAY